jgi:hypothetical protein
VALWPRAVDAAGAAGDRAAGGAGDGMLMLALVVGTNYA